MQRVLHRGALLQGGLLSILLACKPVGQPVQNGSNGSQVNATNSYSFENAWQASVAIPGRIRDATSGTIGPSVKLCGLAYDPTKPADSLVSPPSLPNTVVVRFFYTESSVLGVGDCTFSNFVNSSRNKLMTSLRKSSNTESFVVGQSYDLVRQDRAQAIGRATLNLNTLGTKYVVEITELCSGSFASRCQLSPVVTTWGSQSPIQSPMPGIEGPMEPDP